MGVNPYTSPIAIDPTGSKGFLVFIDGGGHFTVLYTGWSLFVLDGIGSTEGELFLMPLVCLYNFSCIIVSNLLLLWYG